MGRDKEAAEDRQSGPQVQGTVTRVRADAGG